MTNPQIGVRNLYYAYRAPNGEVWPALQGVDLEIEAGEYVAIIGRMGRVNLPWCAILMPCCCPSRGMCG